MRKIRFQSATAWSCQKIAASVWSAVRVVLVERAELLDLIEVLCVGALVSGFGPSVRSIIVVGTIKGRTLPTQGAGSFAKFGGVGRQIPGASGTALATVRSVRRSSGW